MKTNRRRNLMKQILCGLIFLLLSSNISMFAQKINPYLLGNNYWYNGTAVADLMKPGAQIAQACFQTIRIGGFGPNTYSDDQYLEYIRNIKNMGAKPIVQIRATATAQQATDFIKKINITNNLGVRVWSIGNEPDHSLGGSKTDAQIADYTKRIAEALKAVDPTIIVIALEFSEYNATRYGNLIGGANSVTGLVPGKDYYYVDLIGFHRYVMTDASEVLGSINDLIGKINAANSSRPEGKKLGWCMGEFNSHYSNDMASEDQKCWSFNNGQLHGELYGIGMQNKAFALCSWSILEGDFERAYNDHSLFDKANLTGRSSYWHSLMLGQNLKQNYLTSTDNQAKVAIVAMGDETGAAVMIINKDKVNGYNYTIRLDNGPLGSGGLQISVNAGINVSNITGTIGAVSTQMLVFCPNGTLLKRYTYNKAKADLKQSPTIEQIQPNCVDICNIAPTIDPVPDKTYEAGTGVQNIPLTGISDGNNCTQVVSVEASSDAAAIAKIAGVNYTSCNSTGTLSIDPLSLGTATITVKVIDSGSQGCPGKTTTITFKVKVEQTPQIPGQIEAESFVDMFGVTTEVCKEGGINVGYIDKGDWLTYKVNVTKAGKYSAEFRVAGWQTTGRIELQDAANVKLTAANVPNTSTADNMYQNWLTVPGENLFTLTAGIQILRIYAAGAPWNLNWFKLTFSDPVLTRIEVTPNPNTLTIEDTIQFTAKGFDQFNAPMAFVIAQEEVSTKMANILLPQLVPILQYHLL
jgi:hypothetical protein